MAVDTAAKRASSAQMLLHFLQSPPFPSGGIDQAVRQHIVHVYRGILSVVTGVALYPRLERYIRGLHRGLGGH